MDQIVQHTIDPSSLARYRLVLCALRMSDLSDRAADLLWDQAAAALNLSSTPLQCLQLITIEQMVRWLCIGEGQPCSQ